MNYSLAVMLLSPKRVALRTSAPDNRISMRFGECVLLHPDSTTKPRWMSWTPTEGDMKADDWEVLEADGTQVPPPRAAEGADRQDDPPVLASGGRGEGTGWKRA